MLRSAPLLRRGALLIRGRNGGSIRSGPGAAERHEECRTASGTPTFATALTHFPSSTIIAAPFSAIIAVGVLVLPEVIVGITEASATRKPAMP